MSKHPSVLRHLLYIAFHGRTVWDPPDTEGEGESLCRQVEQLRARPESRPRSTRTEARNLIDRALDDLRDPRQPTGVHVG